MTLWDQNLYQRAWNFASNIHQGQTLPASDIPYINHLGLVAMEAMAAVANGNVEQPNLLVMCALLHDAIEDTPTTYEQLTTEFGIDIANGVAALTKDESIGTKYQQMQDSVSRIKQQPKEVWMVKICDRITNLQAPPSHWDSTKMLNYQQEARLILEELGEASPFLAARLSNKIEAYQQYFGECHPS